MKRFALLAFVVFALAGAAHAQQDADPGGGGVSQDTLSSSDRMFGDMFSREIDRAAERDASGVSDDGDALCSDQDALAGRCIVVARLPRCPGDPRCPDPTRVRPDTDTPQ